MLMKMLLILIMLPLVVSCAAYKDMQPRLDKQMTVKMKKPAEQSVAVNEPALTSETSPPAPNTNFQMIHSSDGSSRRGPSQAQVVNHFRSDVMLVASAEEMRLVDFINYAFSDVLGVNYYVDDKISKLKNRVTLNLKNKISEKNFFEQTVDILQAHNISIEEKQDVYYLWHGQKGQNYAIGIGSSLSDIPLSPGMIQQLVPIKYIDAINLKQLLPKIDGIKVKVAIKENLLIISGLRSHVVKALGLVNTLDRPAMRGRYIGLKRLEYWDADDMAKKIAELLKQQGIPVASQPGSYGVYINALKKNQTVIIFAAEKHWLTQSQRWLELLDVIPEHGENQYFVYLPRNARAENLADSLSAIIGVPVRGGVAKAESENLPGKNRPVGSVGSRKNTKKIPAPLPAMTLSSGDDINIAVDPNRNALIIHATPQAYRPVHSLLKKLDVMPAQILLEVTIAEVTLKDSLEFGLEWFLNNSPGGDSSILSTLGGLGLGSGGMKYSYSSDDFQLVINALATQNLVKILSSPRMVVRDGKTASFVVGTEVPIVTSESTADTSTDGNTDLFRSIQYRSTGVTIKVTPMINAENVVTLEIYQETSEAQTNTTSDISSPLILNRTISTEVVAADGQAILLAGLIKESKGTTVNKVPILGDIPLVGYLFKTNSDSVDRTELVVTITPRIIRTTSAISQLQDELKESFNYLEPMSY